VIVEAAARLKAQSFLIDGEVVIARDDARGAAGWSKGQYHSDASGSSLV
jgi:ATP-dependent DNA ligase